jgi:hypothetical protein
MVLPIRGKKEKVLGSWKRGERRHKNWKSVVRPVLLSFQDILLKMFQKKKKKIDFNQNALLLEFGKTLFGLTSQL